MDRSGQEGRRDLETDAGGMTPSTSSWVGRGMHEWWYFDARLENDYTVVVFFHASNPNPGIAGKERTRARGRRPNGERTQRFIEYARSRFIASREKPDVPCG